MSKPEADQMYPKYREIEKFKEEFGSSFYIFSPEQFSSNYESFVCSFQKYYPLTKVAYAYKANYMPVLGDIVNKHGGMIEVASRLEYDIALKSIEPKNIIFNGPMKTKEDLTQAIKLGSIVNVDSFYELDYIKELLDEREIDSASIGIRINYKIPEHSSRFGFDINNGEFDKAITIIEQDNRIHLVAIHSHFTTKKRCLNTFTIRTKKMVEVYNKLYPRHDIRYIDIGGGFFGGMTPELIQKYNLEVPTIDQYAKTITSVLHEEIASPEKPTLVIEPGISMVANIMHLFAEILEIKKIGNTLYAVCDSSINVVNPEKSKITPSYRIISQNNEPSEKKVTYIIVGNTCLEYDIIIEKHEGTLKRGDFIMFINKGAYSHVRTPIFIMPRPPIIGREGQIYKEKDSSEYVLEPYIFETKQ